MLIGSKSPSTAAWWAATLARHLGLPAASCLECPTRQDDDAGGVCAGWGRLYADVLRKCTLGGGQGAIQPYWKA